MVTTEVSRTDSCENCGTPTSFERRDPTTQPPEGEVCEQCQAWLCPDCVHEIGEPCPVVGVGYSKQEIEELLAEREAFQ